MKLVCSQADLNAALQLVSRAVSGRPTHPVLANVLLTADAATGRLSLTGFDGGLGIQTSCQASVQDSGAITLPARLFSDIVSRLASDSPITMEASDTEVELTSLSGSYEVRGISADDFPALPLAQNGSPITLAADAVIRGLRATMFASSTDESKLLITGVHLRLDATGLECAATDGHRLAVLHLPAASPGDPFAVTIPARSLRELERLLTSRPGAEPLSLFCDRGQMVALRGDQVLTSPTLEGTYPNYAQLIPKSFSNTISLDRRAFLAALERVAVLADPNNNVVKVTSDPDRDQVLIRADAQELGRGSESLTAEISGEAVQIAFNARYLLDGLKAMAADRVVLHCNAPTTPVILRAADAADGFTYLVMPVQVRS